MSTLLALHAHPDDESSKGAGTVAKYAAAGVRCVLVTATGGEAGDILNPAMDRPEVKENLAAYRHKELHLAAGIIGYHEVVELGYRDSGMPNTDHNEHPDAFVNADYEEVLERVVALVRTHRPRIMMGYDDHERYPHPDHLRIHQLGIDAFHAAADPERFVGAGPAWQVDRLVAPIFGVRRLLTLHQAAVDNGYDSPYAAWIDDVDHAGDDHKPLVHVPIPDTVGVSREALRAHATQVDPNGRWFSLPMSLVAEVYPYEDFEVLAAHQPIPEGSDDLFAGL